MAIIVGRNERAIGVTKPYPKEEVEANQRYLEERKERYKNMPKTSRGLF